MLMTWIVIFRHMFLMIGAFGMLTTLYEYFIEKHITKSFAKAQRKDFIFSMIILVIGLVATLCI